MTIHAFLRWVYDPGGTFASMVSDASGPLTNLESFRFRGGAGLPCSLRHFLVPDPGPFPCYWTQIFRRDRMLLQVVWDGGGVLMDLGQLFQANLLIRDQGDLQHLDSDAVRGEGGIPPLTGTYGTQGVTGCRFPHGGGVGEDQNQVLEAVFTSSQARGISCNGCELLKGLSLDLLGFKGVPRTAVESQFQRGGVTTDLKQLLDQASSSHALAHGFSVCISGFFPMHLNLGFLLSTVKWFQTALSGIAVIQPRSLKLLIVGQSGSTSINTSLSLPLHAGIIQMLSRDKEHDLAGPTDPASVPTNL